MKLESNLMGGETQIERPVHVLESYCVLRKRKSRKRRLFAVCAGASGVVRSAEAFTGSNRRPRVGVACWVAMTYGQDDLLLPEASKVGDDSRRIASESNFWYSVVRKQDDVGDTESDTSLPCVPTLDNDGPLPPGAYFTLDDAQYEPKPTCRISVAVDLGRKDDDDDTAAKVAKMHRLIDSGFTSFQLKQSSQDSDREEVGNIFHTLRRETPQSVLDKCQLTVPMPSLPKDAAGVNAGVIRRTILDSAGRIGGEAIDNLQLQCIKDSPYFLDVLDCLEDLKREGLVRAVSGYGLPTSVVESALRNGFAIDSNQLDINLLDPCNYEEERRSSRGELQQLPLLASHPLAGGILTNRYLPDDSVQRRGASRRQKHPPTPSPISKKLLTQWGERLGLSSDSVFGAFQTTVTETLQEIANSYRVSVSAVALRWLLQLDGIYSATVTYGLTDDDRPRRKSREQELREVYSFCLDDHDMERLNDLAGLADASDDPKLNISEDELLEMMEQEQYLLGDSDNDRPPPMDLSSNRRLWL